MSDDISRHCEGLVKIKLTESLLNGSIETFQLLPNLGLADVLYGYSDLFCSSFAILLRLKFLVL